MKSRISVLKALDIMIKICMVMKDIHDKYGLFVHADIRPDNFLYDDISKSVWFIDMETLTFLSENEDGISDILQLGGYTISPDVEGFSAPEVFEGNICVQSDVFSLGKLFGFLIGMCGFDGKFIDPGKDGFHKESAEIIRKCTHSAVAERYENASVLLDELCGLFNSSVKSVPDNASVPKYGFGHTEQTKKRELKRKSKIVYVGGNRCFASELSYAAARKNNFKTLLLGNDNSYGAGTFDYFLDMRNKRNISIVSEKTTPFFCDCRHLYLTDERQWVVRGILTNSRGDNLYVSDCDVFAEFDINDNNGLEDLISWSDKYFDVIIICDFGNFSTGVSGEIMTKSDCIIVPVRPDIDEVYFSFKQYRQVALKYGFSVAKTVFVAWEYEEGVSMPINDFKIAVDGQYGGYVPYDVERLKSKNISGDFYCEHCSEKTFLIYNDLINRIIAL